MKNRILKFIEPIVLRTFAVVGVPGIIVASILLAVGVALLIT